VITSGPKSIPCMETKGSSDISVPICHSTRCHVPEDCNVNGGRNYALYLETNKSGVPQALVATVRTLF
jgi:hypothetical protein